MSISRVLPKCISKSWKVLRLSTPGDDGRCKSAHSRTAKMPVRWRITCSVDITAQGSCVLRVQSETGGSACESWMTIAQGRSHWLAKRPHRKGLCSWSDSTDSTDSAHFASATSHNNRCDCRHSWFVLPFLSVIVFCYPLNSIFLVSTDGTPGREADCRWPSVFSAVLFVARCRPRRFTKTSTHLHSRTLILKVPPTFWSSQRNILRG